jgi:hypothetical protein
MDGGDQAGVRDLVAVTKESGEGQLKPISAAPLNGAIQGFGKFVDLESAPAGEGPRRDRLFGAKPRTCLLVPPREAAVGVKELLAMVHGLRFGQVDAILYGSIVPKAARAHAIQPAKINRFRELALGIADRLDRDAQDSGRGVAMHADPGPKGREHGVIRRDHGGESQLNL